MHTLLIWQNNLDAQFLQRCLQPLETTPWFGLVCKREVYPLHGLLHSRSTIGKLEPSVPPEDPLRLWGGRESQK